MPVMPEIKLGKVYFKHSAIYKYGLYQCTAQCGADQHEMWESGLEGIDKARKHFEKRAYDYFVCYYEARVRGLNVPSNLNL
jgi:hypothetical protein